MTTEDRIIEHLTRNPGVSPHWATLGTTYGEGHAAYQKLFAAGVIEWRKVPSKSGKTMQRKIFLVK